MFDLGSLYQGQLAAAQRGIHLLDDRRLLIRDELRADGDGGEVRWAMLTAAAVELDGARATLRQDGRELELRVLAPLGVELDTYESAQPPAEWDAPNPGTTLVGFRLRLASGEAASLRVLLVPGAASDLPEPAALPLSQWPASRP